MANSPMFVPVKPMWVQVIGFMLVLVFGGSLGGILGKVGLMEERIIPPIYQNDTALPICALVFGLGLGMYCVPRIIFSRRKENNKTTD